MKKKLLSNGAANLVYYNKYYLSDHSKYLTAQRTKGEAEALIKWFGRIPDSVCDIGCGDGRHLAAFQELGVKYGYGLDSSARLVTLAKKRLAKNKNFLIEQGTFSNWMPKDESYDITYILFGGFSYCLDKKDAEQLVAKMVRSVKKGGIVCIDVDNLYRLISVLSGKAKKTMDTQEEFKLDATKMILTARDIRDTEIMETKMRYYLPTELVEMFVNSGVAEGKLSYFGDFNGEAYTYQDKRLIVLGKK